MPASDFAFTSQSRFDAESRRCKLLIPLHGEMSEWLKEHAWKACVGETLPRVRIPLSPPNFALARLSERDVFRPSRGSRRDSARTPHSPQTSLSLVCRSETSSDRRAALAATRHESHAL